MAASEGDDGESAELDHVIVAGATKALRRVRRGDASTAIVKVVHTGGSGSLRWQPTLAADHPFYWKREPLAFATGLLERECHGLLRAPRVYRVDDAEDGVAIEMEDVDAVPGSQWPLEQYGVTARHLGAMQGRYLCGRPLPTEAWLSRHFVAEYNRRFGVQHNPFVELLDALARAFVHHDFHPGNLFATADGTTVAIDWAFCGISAFGDDAANLVLDTMLDVVVDARLHADELYGLVVDGFTAGLCDAGWGGDVRLARLAIDAGMVAKFAWFDEHRHAIVDVADARAAVERKYGQPFDEVHAQRDAAMHLMHARADAACAAAHDLGVPWSGRA